MILREAVTAGATLQYVDHLLEYCMCVADSFLFFSDKELRQHESWAKVFTSIQNVILKYCYGLFITYNNHILYIFLQVESLSPLVTLTLSDNRFECNCTTLWMKQWLITHRHQVLDIDQILCASGQPQGQVSLKFGMKLNDNIISYDGTSDINKWIIDSVENNVRVANII